jgi:hypothetical protein
MQTLGWNRNNNPVLNFRTYDEYISWQKNQWEVLGDVKKIKTALPANVFADKNIDEK